MGILNGGIQSLFGTVFGAFYLDAWLITVTNVYANDGTTTETTTFQAIKMQEDAVDERTRAAGNFSQNEKRFIVLQKGVTGQLTGDSRMNVGGTIVDDEIFGGITYALREPEQDPAKSYWLVRGVPV